jgi:tetratricopeptide (TPR) repeat protein
MLEACMLEFRPRKRNAWIWRTLMRLGIGLLAISILTAASAIAQEPGTEPPCLAGGSVSVEEKLASCTAMIESGLDTPRNLAIAYASRGGIYLDKRDFERAIADFDQAIQLDPKSSRSYNARGRAYQGKLQHDRAIEDFDEAIALDPTYAAPLNNRGNAYRSKGQLDRAVEDYARAIEINPNFALAFANRGIAYQNKGQNDRAESDFDRAVVPKTPSFYTAEGISTQPSRLA